MDVWDYFEGFRDEIDDLSLDFDEDRPAFFTQEGEANDQRGRVFGRLGFAGFDDETFLQVHEVVVVERSKVRREKYAYYLFIDAVEVGAYECDPSHGPDEALHMHCSDRSHHERFSAPSVTFRTAVEKAWVLVSARAAPIGL